MHATAALVHPLSSTRVRAQACIMSVIGNVCQSTKKRSVGPHIPSGSFIVIQDVVDDEGSLKYAFKAFDSTSGDDAREYSGLLRANLTSKESPDRSMRSGDVK